MKEGRVDPNRHCSRLVYALDAELFTRPANSHYGGSGDKQFRYSAVLLNPTKDGRGCSNGRRFRLGEALFTAACLFVL